jgi:HD-GYP domain-containing protein (c-di-GMP phosphodiesterase class II)
MRERLGMSMFKIMSPNHEKRRIASEGFSSFDPNKVVDESVTQINEIFQVSRRSKKVPLLEIQQQIIPHINQITNKPNLLILLTSLKSKDDYTYRHSFAVAVISTLIGKWFGLKENELSELATSAILHDIGKLKIPLDILNNPGKLTKDEYDFTKKHSIFGYEMIKETAGSTHRQALVALQHHERQDGSGYPFGIGADKIDLFSRIVGVADVFHAMTSKRAYRNAFPFYETLKQMHQNAFGVFDARIIHLFLNKMMQSLVGNHALLTDGRIGCIIMINPEDPIRPLVRIEKAFVDLSKESTIHVEQIVA